MDFILIGNISQDNIHIEDRKIAKIGGPVFYMAQIFADFSRKVGVCVKFNKIPNQIKNEYIDLKGFIKAKPTIVDIFEKGEQSYGEVSQYSGQINYLDIPKEYFQTKYFVISTIFDDISADTIKKIKAQYPNIKLCLDIQGFMRERKFNQPLTKTRINLRFLQGIELIKLNKEEFDIQFIDKKLGIASLFKLDVKMCLITNGKGPIELYSKSDIYKYQPKTVKTDDTIGAGDMLLASFIHYLDRDKNIDKALQKVGDYISKKLYQR